MDSNKQLEKNKEKYAQSLSSEEAFIGMMLGMTSMSGWVFLLGPLGVLFMKQYILVVSDQKIHFNKLNLMGKVALTDTFNYDEIKNIEIDKGLVKYTLKFYFKNDRKITLKVQHLVVQKAKDAMNFSQALEHIEKIKW